MSNRPLRYLGDPVLRTPSDPVAYFDDALGGLVEDLLDTVQEPGRAGLAANQIGASLAVFAYNVDGQLGYLINPRIVEHSGDDYGLEGCLSIPGISALRHRSARVTAEGVDLQQERVIVTGTGAPRQSARARDRSPARRTVHRWPRRRRTAPCHATASRKPARGLACCFKPDRSGARAASGRQPMQVFCGSAPRAGKTRANRQS